MKMIRNVLAAILLLAGSLSADTFYLIDDTFQRGAMQRWNDQIGSVTFRSRNDGKLYMIKYEHLKRATLDNGDVYEFRNGQRVMPESAAPAASAAPSGGSTSGWNTTPPPQHPILNTSLNSDGPDTFYLIDNTICHGILQEWDDNAGTVLLKNQKDNRLYLLRYNNLKRVELSTGESYVIKAGGRFPEQKQAPVVNTPRTAPVPASTQPPVRTPEKQPELPPAGTPTYSVTPAAATVPPLAQTSQVQTPTTGGHKLSPPPINLWHRYKK